MTAIYRFFDQCSIKTGHGSIAREVLDWKVQREHTLNELLRKDPSKAKDVKQFGLHMFREGSDCCKGEIPELEKVSQGLYEAVCTHECNTYAEVKALWLAAEAFPGWCQFDVPLIAIEALDIPIIARGVVLAAIKKWKNGTTHTSARAS